MIKKLNPIRTLTLIFAVSIVFNIYILTDEFKLLRTPDERLKSILSEYDEANLSRRVEIVDEVSKLSRNIVSNSNVAEPKVLSILQENYKTVCEKEDSHDNSLIVISALSALGNMSPLSDESKDYLNFIAKNEDQYKYQKFADYSLSKSIVKQSETDYQENR